MKTIHFEEIDSTNTYLKEHYKDLDNLTFVSADYQTNGKGREDRKWVSSKEENLLFSVLIKDKSLIDRFSSLSVSIAAVLGEFFENELNIRGVEIKWPNDLYINEKKVCGILLEGSVPNYLVIGIGINVNQTSFIDGLRHIPTSLYLESNILYKLDTLKNQIYTYIYNSLINFDKTIYECRKYFVTHNFLLNKHVNIGNYKGIVTGINDNFEIVLDHKTVIDTGEASVVFK